MNERLKRAPCRCPRWRTCCYSRRTENFKIGRILHLKSEIRDFELNSVVQFKVSDFGFEMQDSSNFEISALPLTSALPFRRVAVLYCPNQWEFINVGLD